MKKTINRKQLLESFRTLQSRFESSLKEAQSKEKQFEDLRKQLVNGIDGHLHRARKGLLPNNPIQKQVEAFIATMDATQSAWNTKVAGREKGVAFRKDFEDSLLVFVSGKVKSGKSSLGNYMAWGETDPTDTVKRQTAEALKPSYKSHANTGVSSGDAENEAETLAQFRVGATEATSSIQSFTLPGFTWVDSPGLHSDTKENGGLAKEYLDHADLILYTTNSDAVGRNSDSGEIKEILKKGKKALLVIPNSDTTEEDEPNDGPRVVTVVMKSEDDRNKQCKCVREQVSEACKDSPKLQTMAQNIDIVSVSARFAQLHADDADAFEDSGMGQLCETLHCICHSEGVRLKQRTPMVNLRNFLQICQKEDLVPYQKLIKDFKDPLNELKKESERNLRTYIQQGQGELAVFIDDFFTQLETQRSDKGKVTSALAEFDKNLATRYREIAGEQLSKIFEEVMAGFRDAVQSTYQHSDLMKKLPTFRIETATHQIHSVEKGTRARNSTVGAALGGIGGFLLGGPLGAGIGATLGGWGGSAAGKNASTQSRDITVTVGDNLVDMRLEAIRSVEKALGDQMRASADKLWQAMDRDVNQLIDKLEHEINSFKDQLQSLLNATTQMCEAP